MTRLAIAVLLIDATALGIVAALVAIYCLHHAIDPTAYFIGFGSLITVFLIKGAVAIMQRDNSAATPECEHPEREGDHP